MLSPWFSFDKRERIKNLIKMTKYFELYSVQNGMYLKGGVIKTDVNNLDFFYNSNIKCQNVDRVEGEGGQAMWIRIFCMF